MKSIYEDTPLIPEIIADTVCREACSAGLTPPEGAVASLAARAERQYAGAGGPQFAKRCRSASGREYLYAFMRHWLAAMLLRNGTPRDSIPQSWANGSPMP